MALLDRAALLSALARLGQLALAAGETIELFIVGGGVMVLEFGTGRSTADLDAIVGSGAEAGSVRQYAEVVAAERGRPADRLNDAAKG